MLEKRKSQRFQIRRLAKIVVNDSLPRDCLITDISEGGARLHAEYTDMPDEFDLLVQGPQVFRRRCRVSWRLGFELGAQFVPEADRKLPSYRELLAEA